MKLGNANRVKPFSRTRIVQQETLTLFNEGKINDPSHCTNKVQSLRVTPTKSETQRQCYYRLDNDRAVGIERISMLLPTTRSGVMLLDAR